MESINVSEKNVDGRKLIYDMKRHGTNHKTFTNIYKTKTIILLPIMSTFTIQETVGTDDKDIIRFVSINKDKKKITYYMKKEHVIEKIKPSQQIETPSASTLDLLDKYCLGSDLDLELELLDIELQSESDETIPNYKDSEWWDYIWETMDPTCEEKLVWTF